MRHNEIDNTTSLGDTLDRLLDETAGKQVSSFRSMAQAASLDPARDFIGASLRNMDFRDEDLSGFDFSHADLTGADFRRAKVDGVAFRGAELRGAIGLPDSVESTIGKILPRVSANLLSGLIETLAEIRYNGKADLPTLADDLHLELDELFPVSESLQLLHLAEIEGSDIKLTDAGQQFATVGLDDRKKLFQSQLSTYVPLAGHIRYVLSESVDRVVPRSRFLNELEDHMSAADAEGTLRAVTAWGRFAEMFDYDEDSALFRLQEP